MKIVQSVYRYSPAMGGVEDYVRELTARFDSDYAVEIHTTNLRNHWDRSVVDAPMRESCAGIDVIRHPLSSLRLGSYSVSWPYLKSLLKTQADLYHGHSFMYCSADYAAMAARIKRKPFVFNPYLADEGRPSFLGRCYRQTLGRLLMSADAVVVISPYERELLSKWGYSRCRHVVEIPPGIDLAEFDGVQHNALAQLARPASHYLFTAGRIDFNKGLDVMVRALPGVIHHYPDLQWVVAGPDFGYQSTLEAMIKDLGVDGHVQFVGAVSRSDLCSLYKHADIFVFPTRYEAFGIVAAEAMAAQTPVVATRAASLPYVVEDQTTGLLFHKDDSDDLARKILDLLGDEKLRQQMGRCGYHRVQKLYNWDVSARQLQQLYQRL